MISTPLGPSPPLHSFTLSLPEGNGFPSIVMLKWWLGSWKLTHSGLPPSHGFPQRIFLTSFIVWSISNIHPPRFHILRWNFYLITEYFADIPLPHTFHVHTVAVQTTESITPDSSWHVKYLLSPPCASPPAAPSGFYDLMWFIVCSLNKLIHSYPITALIFSLSFFAERFYVVIPVPFHSPPI